MADLRQALYGLVPDLPYMTRYEGVRPADEDEPPWVILTVSLGIGTTGHARQVIGHRGTLEARIAALTATQADMAALTLLDAMTGATPTADGCTCGTLNLELDSETYDSGDSGDIVSPMTASTYYVRVIRWRFDWSPL